MQIYVGNLAYSVSEEDLTEAFSAFGDVASVNIIKDRMTGQSKGFGFVEMPSDADAQSAIKSLDGKSINGRPARVNKSEPKKEGGGGGGQRRPRY